MAKGKGAAQHSIHGGLSSKAPAMGDASRKISSGKHVDDGAVRKGVAVGNKEQGPDKGKLK